MLEEKWIEVEIRKDNDWNSEEDTRMILDVKHDKEMIVNYHYPKGIVASKEA